MPERRVVSTTHDGQGNIVEQITKVFSDEELEREKAEKAVAELSTLPDTELTTTKLKKLVKALAKLRR